MRPTTASPAIITPHDRGFALRDPNGVTLCICSDREPAPKFRAACPTGAAS